MVLFLVIWFAAGLAAWILVVVEYGKITLGDALMFPVAVFGGFVTLMITSAFIEGPVIWERKKK